VYQHTITVVQYGTKGDWLNHCVESTGYTFAIKNYALDIFYKMSGAALSPIPTIFFGTVNVEIDVQLMTNFPVSLRAKEIRWSDNTYISKFCGS
jgi:hypothetical protein